MKTKRLDLTIKSVKNKTKKNEKRVAVVTSI